MKKQQEKDAINIGVQDGSRAATSEIEPSPQHWYVVRTAPRGEYLAAEELRDQGTYGFANGLIMHPEMNALLA